MSIKALERHLAPLMPFLQMDGVTEICINQPEEVFVEQAGKFQYYSVPELEYGLLETLAALVAEFNDKSFPSPLVSGSLPTGERVQFVMSPATEKGKVVCSIRRHQMRDMTLNNYEERGVFDELKYTENTASISDDKLREQFQKKNYLHFIEQAIQSRKNILISGGTGTGKTTFLNACIKCIPKSERLITVEDTREVRSIHPNTAHLLFNEDDDCITSLIIFKACLRLRPDRIFLSELRGAEVWPYLRAANSGHPGSLSTVHADSPEGAITQLVFMMQQAGTTSNEEQIRSYIKSIIHVVVQLKRHPDPSRFMYVSEVNFSG
ncbi:MAG TPA: P-type DNA transfer ATPase VirB11 [Candidatus Babeliales bacterium]|nr:P-type DNA transfer ATPase VirB11 [Candidatus Babeliales bacterium]